MSKNQSDLKLGLLKFGFQNFFFSPDSKRLFLLLIINARLFTICSRSVRSPGVVGLTGLEPVTLRLSSACSNQLSYRPGSREISRMHSLANVEVRGLEPLTYSLQSYRSTN